MDKRDAMAARASMPKRLAADASLLLESRAQDWFALRARFV
jgi:hypothetical protein